MVTLFCAIVGVEGNAFSIDIDVSKSVDHLKDAIKLKNEDEDIKCSARKLELFLAKKGSEWLTQKQLEEGISDTSDFKPLKVVAAPLQLVGLSEKDVAFELTMEDVETMNTPIHVLVVVPTDDTERNAKRPRAEAIDSRQLEVLGALAQHLNGAKVGTLLDTPKEIFGTRLRNGLYIRQEYSDLYDIISHKLVSDRSICRILVIGSPGIGKSVFGIFLLLSFMLQKKDIAYGPLNHSPIYFSWDNKTGGYEVSDTPRLKRTYNGLFDGNASDEAIHFGISNCAFVFASPRTKNYNEFVKEDCFKVYMNPWTKVECQRLADAIHADDDEWLRRYNLVGGIPRFLFSSSTDSKKLVRRVKDEIPKRVDELEDQVALFMANVFDDRMKHTLFNLYREENDPTFSYLTYSSLVVEAMISVRYNIQSAARTRSLLRTTEPNLQAWRGKELEKFLLQDLATSTFEMKVLEDNAEAITEYGPLNAASKIVEASSEIKNELVLNIPLLKIFPAIDAVLVVPDDRRIIYAQATVSTAYPIKYRRLKDVYQHMTQRQEFQGYEHILLYIVSNDTYDGFTVQPYKKTNGKNRTTRININLTQYVGKIIRQ